MKNRKQIISMAMASAMLLGSFGFTSHAEDSDPLRVGSLLALGTATPFVAVENGLLNQDGLQAELSQFSDGAVMMEAFAAGELDIAVVGVIPVATWISKGVEMKVVASANGGGHVLMTRKDTGITSVADLAGCTVAAPSVATVTDALLRSKILGDAGLDPDKDLTLIPGMKPADMPTALMATKEVDAIVTWEPFAAEVEATYGDDIVVLYDSPKVIKEETGSDAFYPVNVVAASQDMIDNRSDELKAFLESYEETVDFLNEDEEADAVLAKVLEIDEETVTAARERIDYTYEIDQDATMETLDWALQLGYIDEIPAAEDLFYTVK